MDVSSSWPRPSATLLALGVNATTIFGFCFVLCLSPGALKLGLPLPGVLGDRRHLA